MKKEIDVEFIIDFGLCEECEVREDCPAVEENTVQCDGFRKEESK